MKISFTEDFLFDLNEQVNYIARDKPQTARKFKNDLIKKLKKDICNPFLFKKSRYFDSEYIRDYIFKGYISVYEVDIEKNIVSVFAYIKYRDSL